MRVECFQRFSNIEKAVLHPFFRVSMGLKGFTENRVALLAVNVDDMPQ